MLIAFRPKVVLSIAFCIAISANATEGHQVPPQVAGRHYYSVDSSTCRADAPGRPTIQTWRDHVSFSQQQDVLVWGTLCNDVAQRRDFDPQIFALSNDLSTMRFDGNVYIYSPLPPRLCESGTWCVISNDKR
jgi:hypothetical protein